MRLVVIGTGKMARALVSGFLSNHILAAEQIHGVSRTECSRDAFLALDHDRKLSWSNSIPEALPGADLLLLGVKPQQLAEVLPQLQAAPADTPLLTLAAGIKLHHYLHILGPNRRVIRAMPNTPVCLGAGVTAYAATPACSRQNLEWIETLFRSVGSCYQVEEEQLDAITALSGSGPAFVYVLIEALARAAVAEGLPYPTALPIAAQTALGASRMLLESGVSPEHLIQQVASKGGTTEAGLQVLHSSTLADILRQTLHAAAQRSRELFAR
ncbi:MAG: pyrroline-5-carboxylate reductase [Blastochloris sp.]|nr:pyrroline-5-carboxylate reductase [Blastochloris sp.]